MAKAIHVKYLPCTNTLPARYKAYDCDGNSRLLETNDLEFSGKCEYTQAAGQFAMHFGWGGHWVGGGTKEGMVFVQVPSEKGVFQFHSAGW